MSTHKHIAFAGILALIPSYAAWARAAAQSSEALSPDSAPSGSAAASSVPTSTTAQPDESSTDTRKTKASDYSKYRQNALLGNTGLVHLVSADSGAPGTFRLSFLSSNYSGSGFLCPNLAACTRPTNVTDTQDSVHRTGADAALSVTPLPYLEASIGIHSHAVSDNFGTPSVNQVIGDTHLGVKGFMPRTADNPFSFGGLGELTLLGGSGGIDLQTANVALAALGTLDLTNRSDATKQIPLRFHSNIGYLFDNSGSIATQTELARHRPITRIERFGLGINRMDSILMGLGGEYMSALFQPFAEWTLDIAANRQGYTCHRPKLSAGDACMVDVRGMKSTPSRLTLGTRVTPPIFGLNAILALDIGTSATATFTDERAPEIPWNLYLGIGYNIDVATGPSTPVTQSAPTVVEVPHPPERHIIGKVLDEDNGNPIAYATLEFDARNLTGLIARADGSFDTGRLEPGDYKLLVKADGYKQGTCEGTIAAAQTDKSATGGTEKIQNTEIKCSLKAVPSLGLISGQVLDAESNSPVAQAKIHVRDIRDRAVESQTNAGGEFRIENVPTGITHITVASSGYMPVLQDLEVKKMIEVHTLLALHKMPQKPNVKVALHELKLSSQIHFGPSNAVILPESQALVQEIAGALQQHSELTKLEIQAYTDDVGGAMYSKRLADERAQAVLARLVALGVDANRLTATGRGSEKPVAPNTSEANREKNRRIVFKIVK